MSRPISDPRALELAWSKQYARLSRRFASLLAKSDVIVEIGCGRGQLTIPLAERVSRTRMTCVDNFQGPYHGWRKSLSAALARRDLKTRVELFVSGYQTWLRGQPDSKYDAIISSEFLPEIDSEDLRKFLVESYRVLKPGGRTVHSFLSPVARNRRQLRLIEADSDSRWTKTPPAEWFSPAKHLVLKYLKIAGFTKSTTRILRSGLIIRSLAAKELLQDWDIRQIYWKSHRTLLEKEGLEIPDWLIISATKRSETRS